MTEVWKSTEKKFCELCKCYFANNRASVEHHERGMRHKAAVQQKLRDVSIKAREKERTDRETNDVLAQMESGAIASYMADAASSSGISAAYNVPSAVSGIPSVPNRPAGKERPPPNLENNNLPPVHTEQAPKIKGQKKFWVMARAPDERIYYCNTITNETSWLPPAEGFLSIEEQNRELRKQELEVQRQQMEAAYKNNKKQALSDAPDVSAVKAEPITEFTSGSSKEKEQPKSDRAKRKLEAAELRRKETEWRVKKEEAIEHDQTHKNTESKVGGFEPVAEGAAYGSMWQTVTHAPKEKIKSEEQKEKEKIKMAGAEKVEFAEMTVATGAIAGGKKKKLAEPVTFKKRKIGGQQMRARDD